MSLLPPNTNKKQTQDVIQLINESVPMVVQKICKAYSGDDPAMMLSATIHQLNEHGCLEE